MHIAQGIKKSVNKDSKISADLQAQSRIWKKCSNCDYCIPTEVPKLNDKDEKALREGRCSYCGYKLKDYYGPKLSQKKVYKHFGHSRVDVVLDKIPKSMILFSIAVVFISILHPKGILLGLVFVALWLGILVGVVLFLAALPYIVGGVLIFGIAGGIISLLFGSNIAAGAFFATVGAVAAFLILLSLTLLLYILAPALLGALWVYFILLPGNWIAAIIVFIVIALIFYTIVLPFTIGFAICSFAGQLAYLLTVVGFSAQAIQDFLSEGLGGASSNLAELILNIYSVLIFSSLASSLIFVASIIFGIIFVVGILSQ